MLCDVIMQCSVDLDSVPSIVGGTTNLNFYDNRDNQVDLKQLDIIWTYKAFGYLSTYSRVS